MEQNSAKVFSENWNIYKKVVQYNYMHHAEFANKTAAVFRTLMVKKSLRILDIGCGDASVLLPNIKRFSGISYTGYDLSSAALQLAAQHLEREKIPVALKEGDMRLLIQEEKNVFDVIHSSFAIHHLQDNEKRKLIAKCFERLTGGGKMIYVDVFRQAGISRDKYIEDYFSYIRNNWPLLTANEKQPIFEHVEKYDFPSNEMETISWAESARFSLSERYEPDHLHTMLVLIKK